MFEIFLEADIRRGLERHTFAFDEWEQLKVIHGQAIVHQSVKVSHTQVSIPIINDMPTVHNFSDNKFEIVPRQFPGNIVFDVFTLDKIGISEITDGEWVEHIPPLRAEPSSLNQCRVEIA